MDRVEMKEFLIHERISEYFRLHKKNRDKEAKQYETWVGRLKEIEPALARDFQEYMDWLAEHSGNDQEGLYLFGVKDGIRTASEIASLIKD